MAEVVINRHERCLEELETHDTSGTMLWVRDGKPYHYAGNFRWSKSAYIRTLPEIRDEQTQTRFYAERLVVQ